MVGSRAEEMLEKRAEQGMGKGEGKGVQEHEEKVLSAQYLLI